MNINTRPKISVFIATSLDGYIAGENDDLGWLDRFNVQHAAIAPDDDCGYREFFASIDVLVMGRKTYEKVLTFGKWPYEGKRVIVLSHTLDEVIDSTELFKGDIMELVRRLHAEGVKHVYIDGGVTISRFLKEKIVDEITVSIIPVILGAGARLFNETGVELPLRLVSSKSYPSGLVQLLYERVE
jgi:Dihydrofolate reductase